jgi:hypothetical protein
MAFRVNYDQQFTRVSQADRHEATFSRRVAILEGDRKRILEYPSASENETPCLLKFDCDLPGSY